MSTAGAGTDAQVELTTADGHRLGALLRMPVGVTAAKPVPGVVLVHASHHERDAFTYSVGVPDFLADRGVASLRFDIRGRGTSAGNLDHHRMGATDRRGVVHDVAAALAHLASLAAVDGDRLGAVGEQDTAPAVIDALTADPGGRGLVLMSPRRVRAAQLGRLRAARLAVFGLVSAEDRESLRTTTAVYLAGAEATSRLDVYQGLGFGTTMFMARAFEQRDQPLLESVIADWLGLVLAAGDRAR